VETPEIAPSLASFASACEVVDVILRVKKRVTSLGEGGRQLRRAVSKFMRDHKAAYNLDYLKVKPHWCFDIADQMEEDEDDGWDILLDGWVVERLHRRIKSHANVIDNLSRFEGSVLSAMLNTQMESLKATTLEGGLRGDIQPCPGFVDAQMGPHVVDEFGKRVSVADVVINGDIPGLVHACVIEDQLMMLIVQVCQNLEVSLRIC